MTHELPVFDTCLVRATNYRLYDLVMFDHAPTTVRLALILSWLSDIRVIQLFIISSTRERKKFTTLTVYRRITV